VLDGDKLAADHAYFKFGGSRHSPDHKLEAWSADIKGSEYFSIRVRDWNTRQDSSDLVEETDGGVVWNADATAFYYVKLDDNHRPMQVWRHRLGTPQADDILIHQEKDTGWFTHLHESASGRFCVIAGGDHETSEQWLIDLADEAAKPRLVAARETGVQYSVADRGDELFILTDADGAIDFKIVTAPLASPERANWRDLIPHRQGIYLIDIELYAGHLVRLERANALPSIVIRDLSNGDEHAIAFDEAAYSLDTMGGYEFDTTNLRFSYSSMTTPSEVYDYDMATRTRILRKRQEIPSGHDPADYVTTRIMATSHDGAEVPVSILIARTWCATEQRRCCSMATAPTAWRCRRRFPPTGCRWSTAASSTPSPTSAAVLTRAGAGISTASARRRPTVLTISRLRARALIDAKYTGAKTHRRPWRQRRRHADGLSSSPNAALGDIFAGEYVAGAFGDSSHHQHAAGAAAMADDAFCSGIFRIDQRAARKPRKSSKLLSSSRACRRDTSPSPCQHRRGCGRWRRRSRGRPATAGWRKTTPASPCP